VKREWKFLSFVSECANFCVHFASVMRCGQKFFYIAAR
jgi:hypothetical protein